jgi:hypothetical protein
VIEGLFWVFLILLLLPLLYLALRVKAGKAGGLRPLTALEELPALVARSAETDQPLHVSVGVAGVGGIATAETWAGLTLLGQLADESAALDLPIIVTVADATVLPVAQDILQRAYTRYGNPERYDPGQVRFVAPDPMAYAAGTMGLLEREPLAGNVMVGVFGEEYLLMGETGARRGVFQVVGTADPHILPLVYTSADETLVGEEMFAGGAYTSRLPIQVASLLAEDWLRWILIGAIVITAVWKIAV